VFHSSFFTKTAQDRASICCYSRRKYNHHRQAKKGFLHDQQFVAYTVNFKSYANRVYEWIYDRSHLYLWPLPPPFYRWNDSRMGLLASSTLHPVGRSDQPYIIIGRRMLSHATQEPCQLPWCACHAPLFTSWEIQHTIMQAPAPHGHTHMETVLAYNWDEH
jgi:hypothetical protein